MNSVHAQTQLLLPQSSKNKLFKPWLRSPQNHRITVTTQWLVPTLLQWNVLLMLAGKSWDTKIKRDFTFCWNQRMASSFPILCLAPMLPVLRFLSAMLKPGLPSTCQERRPTALFHSGIYFLKINSFLGGKARISTSVISHCLSHILDWKRHLLQPQCKLKKLLSSQVNWQGQLPGWTT